MNFFLKFLNVNPPGTPALKAYSRFLCEIRESLQELPLGIPRRIPSWDSSRSSHWGFLQEFALLIPPETLSGDSARSILRGFFHEFLQEFAPEIPPGVLWGFLPGIPPLAPFKDHSRVALEIPSKILWGFLSGFLLDLPLRIPGKMHGGTPGGITEGAIVQISGRILEGTHERIPEGTLKRILGGSPRRILGETP